MPRRPWMAESGDVQDERYAAEAMDGRERRCSGLGKNRGSDVAHVVINGLDTRHGVLGIFLYGRQCVTTYQGRC